MWVQKKNFIPIQTTTHGFWTFSWLVANRFEMRLTYSKRSSEAAIKMLVAKHSLAETGDGVSYRSSMSDDLLDISYQWWCMWKEIQELWCGVVQLGSARFIFSSSGTSSRQSLRQWTAYHQQECSKVLYSCWEEITWKLQITQLDDCFSICWPAPSQQAKQTMFIFSRLSVWCHVVTEVTQYRSE